MAQSKIVLALVLLTGLAASCGDSSSRAPAPALTATASSIAAAQSRDTSTPARWPTRLTELTFVDPLRGWAIGACPNADVSTGPCRILATEDGGQTWKVQYHSALDIEQLRDLQFLDAQHGFAFGTLSDGSTTPIFATTDGGRTWEKRNSTGLQLESVQFVTAQRGFALARGTGVIFRTTDGGKAWLFVYGSPECHFKAIDFLTANEGWAGGESSDGPCLFHTTDGGRNWSMSFRGAQSAPVAEAFAAFVNPQGDRDLSEMIGHVNGNCSVSELHFVSPTDAWLVVGCRAYFSGGFAVMKTVNAGESWQYMWGLTSCLMSCQGGTYGLYPLFFLDATHAWRQAPGHAIGLTTDGGQTWANSPPVDPSTPWCCGNAFFADALHGWILGQPDAIAVTSDGGLTWATLQPMFVP